MMPQNEANELNDEADKNLNRLLSFILECNVQYLYNSC